METRQTLTSRREFMFLYDIKMGNPNGDPDENRPRVLPDGTHYVTDVRLKRFVRDYLKTQTNSETDKSYDILVDTIDSGTTNLTGRVAAYLDAHGKSKCEGKELVEILLNAFIDARLFGSSFAFKKQDGWEPKTQPKTLTGAVQINHGEVLHEAQEVDIHGTSVFASQEDNTQGTFTTYYGLRYALIGFNGIANEHSAKLSHMTDDDYAVLLRALWNSVRSSGNTRTKVGQVPRLLVSIEYNEGEEFQYGMLTDYLKLKPTNGKGAKEWSGPSDYQLDLSLFQQRLETQEGRISRIAYCLSPDLNLDSFPDSWEDLAYDDPTS
ncbi:MAG: type I-B CRISPR-associated protein Cas7/Csh2 [Gemmatimonadota bacterium]|nr:type I-B CRISPR-associated protein Cas7/Csh2 [Gemmatimonadota bacterium]